MRLPRRFAFFSWAWCLMVITPLMAEVRLPRLTSDNMVLQQNTSVPIWGTAEPGEQVTVTIGDQHLVTKADPGGRWMVELRPMEAGGPFEMAIAGETWRGFDRPFNPNVEKNTLTLENIMVGDVWLCSGQSNMEYAASGMKNADREMADSDYPMIRLFTVEKTVANLPVSDTVGQWESCGIETVRNFPAVGYIFGRTLHKALGVPVGLINNSWGGTCGENWVSRATLESESDFKPILDRWRLVVAEYPRARERFQQQLEAWKKLAGKAQSVGEAEPRMPAPPAGPGQKYTPAGLYNGMVAPLVRFPIKGVIWYQGEGNADRAYQYRKLFPALIRGWRAAWGRVDFPFLFVQLPNYEQSDGPKEAWAVLREAQLMALKLPNTAMAVTIDIGEANNVHPVNKAEVGHRLAAAALRTVYGQTKVVGSGPIYESMRIEGNKIRLRFQHTEGGLLTKGSNSLKGFAVAGADEKFVEAEARIERDTVIVWSTDVAHPKAVRYAWADNPTCNLYNGAGLPASPFRTDDWPVVTMNQN